METGWGGKQTAKLLLFASDGRPGLVLVKGTCAISKAARHSCPLQETSPADAEETKKKYQIKTIASTKIKGYV